MTRLRTFPAPTFHSMSLTRAAFFHARVGDTPALCSVLDHGLPADACNERGETLLHVACSNRRFDAACLLLERGAKPESRSDLGFTPLTTAVMDADHRVIALLLDHGANPDGGGPEGLTPLMLAAMLDCVELVVPRWIWRSRTVRPRYPWPSRSRRCAPHNSCWVAGPAERH